MFPSSTTLLVETSKFGEPETQSTRPALYIQYLTNSEADISDRHDKQCNVLAADGHVKTLKSSNFRDWFKGASAWEPRGNNRGYAECPLL